MKTLTILKINYFMIFLAFLLLFGAIEASATTYYVSPNGSDSNPGTESQPFRNIQKAADTVNPGDTVIVEDGTYTDTNSDNFVVYQSRGGTSANWITFKARNKWGAVLDGQNYTTGYGWFCTSGSSYTRVEDFEIKDMYDHGVVSKNSTTNQVFYRLKIHDIAHQFSNSNFGQDGINVGSGSSNITIDSCFIYTIGRTSGNHVNHDHGIYSSANNIDIINNVFYDIVAGWPIHVYTQGDNIKIVNNTFADAHASRVGHILLFGATNILVQNNIFNDPRDYAIRNYTPGSNSITIKNNLVYSPTASPGIVDNSGGTTLQDNITGQEPVFVDSASRNYDIQTTSAAKDVGLVTGAPSVDIEGNTRPPENYDIGAYESGGTPPSSDTEDPTAPTNLQAQTISSSQINLSWNASTDNVGVTGYNIYRNGTQLTTTASTSYSDTGLTENTSYTYTVSAFDAAGNGSAQSVPDIVTTNADTTPPTIISTGASSDKEITVIFSEPVEQISAETVSNYAIDQGVTVSASSLGADLQTVTLTTSTISEGNTYTLTINNVKDRASVPNTIASNTQKTFTFTSDLVAHWKLDEASGQTINDSSGNNNGTLGGDNTAEGSDPTRVAGNFNNGLQFDGIDDLAAFSNSSTLNNLSSFTYTAWIYPTGFGGGGYGRIISKESSSGMDEVYFLINGPSGNNFGIGVNNTTGNEFGALASTTSITLNTWQQVAVTYDDSGDRKPHLYLNGNEVTYQSQETVTGTLKLTTIPVILGNRISGNRSFQGIIDEVKIYNRALSATEIQNDFNSQPTPSDTEDPTIPTSLQTQVISTSQIDLSWNASTDNVGVTGYNIYRNGTQLTTTASTSYSDTGLSLSTTYTYTVSAFDAAGNESGKSTASQATTTGDTTPPVIPFANTFSDTRVTIIFSEPVEQASAETVSNYAIDQGVTVSAASLGTDLQTVALTTSTLSEGITYTLTVNNVKDRASTPNTIASNTQKTFTFTSDLVAHWKLDETSGQTINDSSGNNNGTLGGNNTTESSDPTRVAGNFNNGLQFDGTGDLAAVSNSSTLNNLSSFTYTAWIYPTGFGGGGYGRIISKELNSGMDEVYFLVNGPNGNNFGIGVNNTTGNEFGTLASTNSITLNTWQHIAVAYDDSGDRKPHLYLNSTEVTYQIQDTVTGTLKLTSNQFIIGNRISGNRSFQGIIDEVKIYNRALSATEIQNDYGSQAAQGDQTPPAPPLGLLIQ